MEELNFKSLESREMTMTRLNSAVNPDFLVVKIDESTFDVLIFASTPVLKAFEKVYSGVFIEDSAFDHKSVCVMPNFENLEFATAWKEYWVKAFSNPEKACQSCQTVNDLFNFINEFSA